MKIRPGTLWRVPFYCVAASYLSFYLTIGLGSYFYVIRSVGENGEALFTVDPLRSAIFSGGMFLLVLLCGGLWILRDMRRREKAFSAGVMCLIYLALVLIQLISGGRYAPVAFSALQNWPSVTASAFVKLGLGTRVAALLSCFSPLLFIPFGKKEEKTESGREE